LRTRLLFYARFLNLFFKFEAWYSLEALLGCKVLVAELREASALLNNAKNLFLDLSDLLDFLLLEVSELKSVLGNLFVHALLKVGLRQVITAPDNLVSFLLL